MKSRTTRLCVAWGKISAIAVVTGMISVSPPVFAATNALTDRTIADAVENEFDYDPAVWPEKIDILAHDGIVTLNGVTDNILEKDRATRLARTVKGVRAVVNNIKVRPDVLKTQEALANDVVESLASDPATDAFEITVDADRKGKITLTGAVDSFQEKHLAGIVAKGTIGVTDVDNRLVVDFADRQNRPENEIKAEVEQRLFWDVLVDDGLINVSVDGNVVKLSGTVGSASERYRANYLSQVMGVSRVDTSGLKVQDWARDPNRRNPDYAAKSDKDIAKAVRDAMRYDPRVSPFGLDVEVSAGEVTLRGTVSNPAAKRSAEQDARNTVGVHRVRNRVKVRPVMSYSADDLEKRVRGALLRDPYVQSYDITVVVDGRIAKLYGTVDSYFEKSQAEYVAERVGGVATVLNNLVVRQDNVPLTYNPYLDNYPAPLYGWYDYDPVPTYRADREIRDDIQDELWWSPFVDSDEVTVTVDAGTATLTGRVDSWSEWRAASENAWEGGAIWVVNNLEVATGGQG